MDSPEVPRRETVNLKRLVEKLQGQGINAQLCKRPCSKERKFNEFSRIP